jgi:hypothetical protein
MNKIYLIEFAGKFYVVTLFKDFSKIQWGFFLGGGFKNKL